MQDIQSGFFYNNIDIIKDGAKTLADTIVKVQALQNYNKITNTLAKNHPIF